MRDKSLDIFLIVFFGVSGMAILTLAWLRPMVVPERILTTFIGSAGFFVAVIRALCLRSPQGGTNTEPVLVGVEVEDKT